MLYVREVVMECDGKGLITCGMHRVGDTDRERRSLRDYPETGLGTSIDLSLNL